MDWAGQLIVSQVRFVTDGSVLNHNLGYGEGQYPFLAWLRDLVELVNLDMDRHDTALVGTN